MIAELIHEVARMGQEEQHKFSPRPSLAGPERCERQMCYDALGFEREPLPGRTLVVFDDGNWHEALTLDWLRKTVYQVSSEQMIVGCPAPMKTGSIDCILTDPTGRDMVLEHKGINHFTFQRYEAGEIPWDYITQLCIYIAGAKKVNPIIDTGLLLIKNKNTGAYIEFQVILDGDKGVVKAPDGTITERPTIVKDACLKFSRVLFHAQQQTVADRPYLRESWHCEYCGHQERCWQGYEAERESRVDLVPMPDDLEAVVAQYHLENTASNMHGKTADKLKEEIEQAMEKAGAKALAGKRYNLIATEYKRKATIPDPSGKVNVSYGFKVKEVKNAD